MGLRFDGWTFEPEERQIIGPNGPVHLTPKAFDLLAALIESRPKALSKAQLQARLWPETVVTEANLPALVREVRAALGDDAKRPCYIRTVQRFGYAFCGAVAPTVALSEESGGGPAFSLVWGKREIQLRDGETVIGRARGVGVRIDSRSVSRQHARIVIDGDRALLEDLGSKNGTCVGGKKIAAPTPLEDNDEIRLGSVLMTFRALSATEPTQTSDGT
jgi:DNA-binding winged helix-turn-helix (wHTH) protein